MEFRNIFKKLARFFREEEGVGAHAHHAFLAIISVSISLAIPSSLAAEAMQEGSREFEFHSSQVEKVFNEDELIQDMAMTNSPDSQKIEMVSWTAPQQNPASLPKTPEVVKQGNKTKTPEVVQNIQKSAELKTSLSSGIHPMVSSKSQNIVGSPLVSLDSTFAQKLVNCSNFLCRNYASGYGFNSIYSGANFAHFTPPIGELSSFIASRYHSSRACEWDDGFVYYGQLNKSVGQEMSHAGMRISPIHSILSHSRVKYKRVGSSSDVWIAWENSPIKEKQIEKYSVFKTIYLWLPNRNEWHSTNFLTQCGNYPLRSMIMKSANDWKFSCSPVKTIYPSALLRFS
jgi:hypothetical protein